MKGASPHILLIEDDPGDTAITLNALRRLGINHQVQIAHNGPEAIGNLLGEDSGDGRKVHELPAFVLLDLNLPGQDGFDILRSIRADTRTQDLPVIILTGSWRAEDILTGFRLKVDSYVCKAIDLDQFAEALDQVGLDRFLFRSRRRLPRVQPIRR
jgi:two-component system, response regulator